MHIAQKHKFHKMLKCLKTEKTRKIIKILGQGINTQSFYEIA
jgi:hypothetical protein